MIRLALLMLVTYALVQATPAHIYNSFPPEHKVKALSEKKTVPPVSTPVTVAIQAETTPAPAVESPVPASGSCGDWLAQAGIPATNSVSALLAGESGCRPNAYNASSGACGIPQALPCSKMGCSLEDPVCQLHWMNSYVAERYGNWDNAYATWLNRYPHWY